MRIFIDESGSFSTPKTEKWSVSCMGALVIPDSVYGKVVEDFDALKRLWRGDGIEIKGKDLGEGEISSVIQMLNKYDVLFESTTIDMGLQNKEKISQHKEAQVKAITANITSAHKPSLVKDLEAIQTRLRQLSDQLYVQFVLGSALIAKVIQSATLYYVQRMPGELGRFLWVIDAKDEILTPYEDLWLDLVRPNIMSKSFTEPLAMLEGADYSAFQKFRRVLPEVPEYLRGMIPNEKPFETTDLREILKEVQFKKSEEDPGLQLVDILSNALRRAMNGNLGRQGWEMLGCLMVGPEKGKNVILMVDLTSASGWVMKKGQVPYTAVAELTDKLAKPMLSAEYLRRHGL